ncbi:MAG: Winged helix DNA-binding domain [Candidatus Sumerlaeota bacterium]|nr:Winged helix DNA-binding domain [Candidatus Sumerlaeota bacterium]
MDATKPQTPRLHEAIANLQQLTELFQFRREQLAREAGLTVQQWRVLEQIAREHFMPSMFARERDSSRAAVSKILRQLQDKGLVSVAVSASNGRHRNYALTERGEEAMALLRASRQRAIDAVWGGFAPADIEAFRAFSARLIARLEEYAETESSGSDQHG